MGTTGRTIQMWRHWEKVREEAKGITRVNMERQKGKAKERLGEKEDMGEISLDEKGHTQAKEDSRKGLGERVEQVDLRVTVRAGERLRRERRVAHPYSWATVPPVASRDTRLDTVQSPIHRVHQEYIMVSAPSAAQWVTPRSTAPNR